MEKGRARVRDKAGKIQLIFDTFAKLVNETGYDRLSTRRIAAAANISVGTIYHYFPGGKHAIAGGFMVHASHAIFDPTLFELGSRNLPEFLEKLLRTYVTSHRENHALHRAIDQALLASPEVVENYRQSVSDTLRHVIVELRRRGLYTHISEQTSLQRFLLFYNLIEAVIHRHLFLFPFFDTDDELIHFLVNILQQTTSKLFSGETSSSDINYQKNN